ncbi:uncharacterized protein LOC131860308 [Cryptomeria japonica]|uniref:uncharacterized protein LOC131860308 n=1 Tax=Cryptomeria japonica TaxID=3369 RepID=UPI0027DA6917|nr:uncharacterized protein LOC131860308 [Cryptomeria japonica]
MDSGGLRQQLLVALEELDQSQSEVLQVKVNLRDAKNFIESLKDQLNKSREKRKKLVDKLKEKESRIVDEEALKEKAEECERLASANVVQENEMEAITVKKENAKLEESTPKPRQSRSVVPSFDPTKPTSKPKPSAKSSGEAKKKRKQVRVVIIDDEETKSHEAIKEVKEKVVKVTKVSKQKLSSRERPSKKSNSSEIDEVMKQGKFEVKPLMSLNKIVKKVVKNGNLNPLSEWYENFDENGKRTLEEATIEYVNVYRKALIELMSKIIKSLYKVLDMR